MLSLSNLPPSGSLRIGAAPAVDGPGSARANTGPGLVISELPIGAGKGEGQQLTVLGSDVNRALRDGGRGPVARRIRLPRPAGRPGGQVERVDVAGDVRALRRKYPDASRPNRVPGGMMGASCPRRPAQPGCPSR